MIHFNKENTQLLKNGNIAMNVADPYLYKMKDSLKAVEISWNNEIVPGLMNISKSEVILKDGYDTTANGSCHDLSLLPGEVMICSFEGDAHSFACYRKKLV
ncbi:MAG: hypothetical protein P8P29_00740 [Flavobacteriaceae bacterium]|nr:hypothetical protein [Flavobacteriaceae bacterium]